MKTASTLLLVGAAAAEYGYAPAAKESSAAAYTTVHPGGTYAPVTVTSQYQTIPTYDAKHSSASEYVYVSTVVTDCDGKYETVTKTDQPVTVSHYKTTITHSTESAYPTGKYPHGGYNGTAYATGKPHYWEELYEKIDVVPYKHIGPSGLPGYPGSGLCKKECYGEEDTKYQPVDVKEYKHGKWSTYTYTYTYGAPTPSATTYKTPGTYTVPEFDRTVHETATVPAEGTYTAPAGKTVTYGGCSTSVEKAGTITAHYGAYETEGASTKTIIKTTTITVGKPGVYTYVKPTVTKYEHETVCHYPTASVYPPGVYHHTKETVTITKSNEPYTCSYHKSSTYPAPSSYATPSASKPVEAATSKPAESYPTASASKPVDAASSKPAESYPVASSKPAESYPVASSKPVEAASSKPAATYSAPTPPYPTGGPSSAAPYPTAASSTTPSLPDPSADSPEPAEAYGYPTAGYVKRGGMLERRKADGEKKPTVAGKRVILV